MERLTRREVEQVIARALELLVTVRHGMSATRADGVLRGLRGVTSRVEDVTDGTVVVLDGITMTTNGPDHGAGDAGHEDWRMMARRLLGRD